MRDASTTTPIVRRRVHIPFDPAKAKGWHLNRRQIEEFMNAISYVFPPGEKFFIQSVQNYQDRITDPALKDQIKRFIYQEAMHTKSTRAATLHSIRFSQKVTKLRPLRPAPSPLSAALT